MESSIEILTFWKYEDIVKIRINYLMILTSKRMFIHFRRILLVKVRILRYRDTCLFLIIVRIIIELSFIIFENIFENITCNGKLFESWWKNVKYTNKIFFFRILNQNLYFLRRSSRILLVKIRIPHYRSNYHFFWS